MTVKLGARIEADVSPLVEALATAEQALDQFVGRIGMANDELSRLGDAGTASLAGLAEGAGLAADALGPLGSAAEAVRAVAALAGLLAAVNECRRSRRRRCRRQGYPKATRIYRKFRPRSFGWL